FLPDGTLTFVNASYSHFVNKKPEDLLGTHLSDAIHAKDRTAFDQCIQSLSRENPVAACQCRFAMPKNPVRWIAWTLRAMYDSQEKPVEYQAVGHDITEKKEAAEKIQQYVVQMEFFSEELQRFIELAPDDNIYHAIGKGLSEILPDAAITVSSYDPKTITLTVRAAFSEKDFDLVSRNIGRDLICQKFRVGDKAPPEGFLSGTVYNTKKDLYNTVFQQIPAEICSGIEDALNLGEFYSIGLIWKEELLGNITFALRKGQKLKNRSLIEAYVRAASISLKRSIAENALMESESIYRTVIENIQDVFYRSDTNGNLIMASPSWASMLGFSSLDECLGRNIARDFYMEPEKRTEFLAAVTSKGSVSNYEVVLKKKDGSPLCVSTNSHTYYSQTGTILGVEGVFRDISERKAADTRIHEYIGEMEFFSQKLLDFITIGQAENIYDKIVSDFKNLVPHSMVVVNSFDPKTGIVTVQSASMGERQREAITRALGKELVGMEFQIDAPGLAAFQTGILHNPRLSLFDIVFRNISKPVCDTLESELGIGEIYAIGFVRGDEIMGNATIFLDRERSIPDLKMIEMYARVAAIALQKYTSEEARRKSDEIFTNITQYSPFPIAIINPDKTFQYINESFIRVFGYNLNDFHTVEEWLHLAFPDPVYRKEIFEVWKSEQENYRPGYTFTKTCQIHCKDSTVKEIVVRAVVLSGENICVISKDTTDRTKAEQTHRLLSSIITSTSDAVIAKDKQGTIISWNRAAEELYGYSADEMIGQNISRIIPAEREEEMEQVFNRIKLGEPVSNMETRRVRKNGRVIDISVSISPITDNAGTVIGASAIARDITPRKAEERLRENEEQYRSLVDNISVGIYRSTGDPRGRFIWGNSSLVKILGYPSFEELSEIGIADLFVEHDGRKKLLDALKKEGFVKNREIALRRADGKTVTVLVTALAPFDSEGGLSCINGIVEDITAQRQAEHCLQIANKQMQDILAGIPDPIVIVDNENSVIAWNTAMEQLTEVQKTGVIGRNYCDHLFPFYDPTRPALFTLFEATDDELNRYYPGAYRDGTAIVAQVQDLTQKEDPLSFFTIRASPLHDPQGERIGAMQMIQPAPPDTRNSTP
ncbi:MAG: PAS domain S-box protein, partial [Methanoregula sp.]